MTSRSLIALLAFGASCLSVRAAPQWEGAVTMVRDVAVTSTLPPGEGGCPETAVNGCIVTTATQQSVTTVTNTFPVSAPSNLTTSSSHTSALTTSESSLPSSIPIQTTSASASISAPVAPSIPPLSTGATTQHTSNAPLVPSIVPPPFPNSTSSSWTIPNLPTSSGLLPTTSSSHSLWPTSAVSSAPLTTLTTRSTSEVVTSEIPFATSSVPEPEDTSRSVIMSTHFETEILTTKTTTTDTEYPPATSVINITTGVTRTDTITTTTTDSQILSLPSCGTGGFGPDGQYYGGACPSTFETITTSSSSISASVDPINTSTTCTDEISKAGPTQPVTTKPSMSAVPVVATNSSTSLSILSFSSSEP
ncbi:uncharacterized protein MYCFIDRAFT_84575 [Pseudocercospora fijiensis CIRAD86]|uniref:Uncharacterized protein n=1 Tax=Pseudocercospora fijiensis (strain CIRAD86) TaxID=383855 RepID=M3BB45_PSEFD|nr:uncharacterized protein MYCFIDRAFT_84575 [Pseudocercospora fijiensis CIRAD86]EME86438.1 hypothetical protein MYCFIDRAFT_84575 [Pseudocercospora fijiensis CIRAD86]